MATPTSAQTGESFRGFVSINGGYQASSTDFRNSIAITEFVEQGSVDSSYNVKAGPQLDVAGGARVWRSLGIGIGITRFSKSGTASVAGKIPHPFFFNQTRSVEGEAAGLKREELAFHIQAMAIVPGGERLSLAVFAGPSFFNVKQGIVQKLQVLAAISVQHRHVFWSRYRHAIRVHNRIQCRRRRRLFLRSPRGDRWRNPVQSRVRRFHVDRWGDLRG